MIVLVQKHVSYMLHHFLFPKSQKHRNLTLKSLNFSNSEANKMQYLHQILWYFINSKLEAICHFLHLALVNFFYLPEWHAFSMFVKFFNFWCRFLTSEFAIRSIKEHVIVESFTLEFSKLWNISFKSHISLLSCQSDMPSAFVWNLSPFVEGFEPQNL